MINFDENSKVIIIPEGVTYIPDGCFKDNKNVEEIILPSSITNIGNEAFYGCENLKEMIIPDNVNTIGNSAFRNCKRLKKVVLSNNITHLSDNCFCNCFSLDKIISNTTVSIGKKCFKNCSSLKSIPSFITNFSDSAFENCIGLTEVDIISSVIPFGCFRGCKNIKKFNNTDIIYSIDNFAFSGCSSLESINLKNALYIPSECFSNCKNLKEVILSLNTKKIGSRSFYKCNRLTNINLPDSIESIAKQAFKYCHSINSIILPASLKEIGLGAFSYMEALENIYISPSNNTFISPDNKILINQMQQRLVLYASGCKDKTYSFSNYVLETDEFDHEIIKPITIIGQYAFAGNKYLEELTLSACTSDIERTAFKGCSSLKILNVEAIPFYTCVGFNIRDNGKYYHSNFTKQKCYLPFETVNFFGNLSEIHTNSLKNFNNIKNINLPTNGAYNISSYAFSDCTINNIYIPNSVKRIDNNSIPLDTEATFENKLKIKGLISLSTHDDYFGKYKLYKLSDGTYYIEKDGKIITITKKEIADNCNHSDNIVNDPVLYLDFKNDLINNDFEKKYLYDGNLISNMSIESRKMLFENVNKDDYFFEKVLTESNLLDDYNSELNSLLNDYFYKVLDFIKIIKKYKLEDNRLYNKLFMAFCSAEHFEKLLNYDRNLLLNILEKSKILDIKSNSDSDNKISLEVISKILGENLLSEFLDDVNNFNITDPFLINNIFVLNCNKPLFKKLFNVYDANIKRALINSDVFTDNSSSNDNLNDLLNLFWITGALNADPIKRQRATTFITEKIFAGTLENGQKNEYRIIGDDIHRIFNFKYIRDEFDEEFANFFLENYKELYELEKKQSGFIERIYNNFIIISKTCTSHKGSQRKLKVTLDKCINYLSNTKFDYVTEENKYLADFIGAWYDNNNSWLKALRILKEAESAPRNIFTKNEFIDGKIVFDNSPSNDLKEKINNNFSYEWLPKQDKDNLLLGKYCNCCAHLEGAGDGIMRASMILDCCQNMVIRNEKGEIISKVTIYVNKDDGYAVFNTIETSLNHRNNEEILKIYGAFMRGTKAFLDVYNINNPDKQLEKITIGTNRNTIAKILEKRDKEHPFINIHKALEYGKYSNRDSGYAGDWKYGQRLVLKK